MDDTSPGITDETDKTDPGDDPAGDIDATPVATPVHFLGRVDLRDPATPRCAWTYCGLATRVVGSGLDLVIGGDAGIDFQVTVDGQPTIILRTTGTQDTHRVAEGLADGAHEITVVRRSEAAWGVSELLGFVPAAGTEFVAAAPAVRRLEVIGDSITAGYGNEGCPFSVDTENGYLSYAAIAARLLGADVHIEAWSGIGMYRDANGSTSGMMPALYGLAVPAYPESAWDFSQWKPDAVLVNLGTNDFARGDPGPPFVEAYVDFVRQVRARYPEALVFCASNGNAAIGLALDEVVETVADANVKRFDFTVPDWAGCDGHPSTAADEAMASQLASRLAAELGW